MLFKFKSFSENFIDDNFAMDLQVQKWGNKNCGSKRGFLSGSENNTNVTSPQPALLYFPPLCSFQDHSVETRVLSNPSVTCTHKHTEHRSITHTSHRLQLSNSFTECLGSAGRYANALTCANCTAKC